MKEEITSFDLTLAISELSPRIQGARISNIYQINQKTMLLRLRKPSQPRILLLIEAGKRLNITAYTHEKPKRPPAFCMALRKHLRNGTIEKIEQHEFERIVTVVVNTREGEFQLTSELFGNGNIILVNPESKILQALTYRRMRDRNVLRGETFQHAPPIGRNPLTLARNDLDEIRDLGQLEAVKGLARFLSIGGLYSEEILLRAEIDKNSQCKDLTEQEISSIFDNLQEILSAVKTGNAKPCVVVDDKGESIDVTPIPLRKHASFRCENYDSINQALDDYYARKTVGKRTAEADKEVERHVEGQKRILQLQEKTLKNSKEEIERNRKIGNTIYTRLNDLQFLLRKIMSEKRQAKPWKQIISDIEKEKEAGLTPAIYYDSLQSSGLILKVVVENLTFALNLRHSIQENAAHYYTRAKRAEKKFKGAEKAIEETKRKMKQLREQQIEQPREEQRRAPKKRKKAWYEKFRWFHSSEGYLVIAGRDATTNEIIIKRHTDPHDIVFHADIHGAPFVLIKTEGKKPSEQTMKESAQLAASYSKAWRDLLSSVSVYWISPEQVNKTPSTGQYLKKGAFSISGPKNYVRNVPLRIAIGTKTEDARPIVVGGPVEAITTQTEIYIELVPGREKSGTLARRIRDALAKKASEERRKQILDIPLERIQRFIPLGRGALKRKS
ncbi:MAG: NFACT family protein [Candidatus Bathyarchaeota archaeon]|nr:MAG: NFACT family protein [Candidatus Bathyarchaeota archaeon]